MSIEPEKPEDPASLYRRAFAEFGHALWNLRPVKEPTASDALAITQALGTQGRMDGRRLAERIEDLCRAHHSCPVPEIRGILLRSKWAAGKARGGEHI